MSSLEQFVQGSGLEPALIEHAALEWIEVVTLVAQTYVPDAAYGRHASKFDEAELVKLTLLVSEINARNRFAISFRLVQPTKRHTLEAATEQASSL